MRARWRDWRFWRGEEPIAPEPFEAPVYALAGERVTCTRGHYICTVATGIRKGDFQKPEDFTDWCFGEAPPPGLLTPPPCECGAIWWRWRSYENFQFHFETGGWR